MFNLPLKARRINKLAQTSIETRKTETTIDVLTIDACIACRTQTLHRGRVKHLTHAAVLTFVLTRIDSHLTPVSGVAERTNTNKAVRVVHSDEANSVVLTWPRRANVHCLLACNAREAVTTQAAEAVRRERVYARVDTRALIETRPVAAVIDFGLAQRASQTDRTLASVAARARVVHASRSVQARPWETLIYGHVAEFARVARRALTIEAAHDVHACGVVDAENRQTGGALVYVRFAIDTCEARRTLTLVLVVAVEQVHAETPLTRVRVTWIAFRLASLASKILVLKENVSGEISR